MVSLTQGIETIVNMAIKEFCQKITEKYNIEDVELENMWNQVMGNVKVNISLNNKAISPPQISSSMQAMLNSNMTDAKGKKICGYRLQKGRRKGEFCGTKIRGDGKYCSKHKKYDPDHEPEPHQEPEPEPHQEPEPEPHQEPEPEPHQEEEEIEDEDMPFPPHYNSCHVPLEGWEVKESSEGLKFVWNSETKFVLKNNRERYVVGWFDEEQQKILKLTEEQKKQCLELNYPTEEEDEEQIENNFRDFQKKGQILFHPELKRYWNEYTGAVFKKNLKELNVVGRLDQRCGDIYELSDQEKEAVIAWGWNVYERKK